MVIQRWQSVFLLIGAIVMIVFCFVPVGNATVENEIVKLMPSDYPVFLTVNILIAVLLFIAIFLFKNTRRQKTVTLVSMLLIAASAATGGFIIYGDQRGAEIEWFGGVILLVVALVMALAAYRGISRDEKLLRSYDRIR